MKTLGSRISNWLYPLLIASAPLIVGRVYPQTVFSPIGNIDFYMFTGLGLDYDMPSLYSEYYKVSRLPWILFEYVFRHGLPPIAAQYAIQHVTHIFAGLALYFGTRALLGSTPAFVGSLFLVTYSEFYSASPPDYMMAFSGALYLATFWVLNAASARAMSYSMWMLCGIVFALCLHTNFIFILFTPALIGHLILVRRRAGLQLNLVAIVGSTIAAAGATTIALGLVAVSFGRSFNFMWPQIRYVLEYLTPAKQTWYQSWASGWWDKQEPYFGAFVALFVVSAILGVLLVRKGLRDDRAAAQSSLLLQYSFAFLLLVVLQTRGQAILEPNEMMYELLMPFGLAFTALISFMLWDERSELKPVVAVAVLALVLVPLCWPAAFTAITASVSSTSIFIRGLVSIAVIAAIVLVGRFVATAAYVPMVLLLALSIGACNVVATSKFAARTVFVATDCSYRRDGYLTILDLNRWFRSLAPRPTDFFIWVDDKEKILVENCGQVNLGDLGWSFRSLGLGAILTPERQTPEFLRDLARRDFAVLVASYERDPARRLAGELASFNAAVKTEPVDVHEGKLDLHFVAILPAKMETRRL